MKRSTRKPASPRRNEQAANNEEMQPGLKALTEQVMALNSQINANSESEKASMRAAVKGQIWHD